jgi:uncharacterized protein (DUF1778 family)
MKPNVTIAPTSIRLDRGLRDALERRAEADGRSLSNYVINALRRHVAATPEPKRKLQKA